MSKIKIVIIEDDSIVSRMYEKSLDPNEFEVHLALGGKEGLDLINGINPDIILCDVMMPEPDGMEVLKTVKSNPSTSHIPIVMLTNLSGKHDSELAMQRGANGYWLKKDNIPAELADKIKVVLGNKKVEQNTSEGKVENQTPTSV